MNQTKLMSFVEAITNTLVGLALAFAVNAALMHWTGVTATAMQNFLIVAGHTADSQQCAGGLFANDARSKR